MFFFAVSIVIITSIVMFLIMWFIESRHKTRQALIWWYTKEHLRMSQEADLIRNNILQELFTLRRHLELSQEYDTENINYKNNDSGNIINKYDISNIQKIHNSLKELSEYLYPPHIEDGLPLAIFSLTKLWELRFSKLTINYEVPKVWSYESEETNRMILMVIHELLQLTITQTDAASISINLQRQLNFNKLEIKINVLELSNIIDKKYLKNINLLQRIFNIFINGKCSFKNKDNTQVWFFTWINNNVTSNI